MDYLHSIPTEQGVLVSLLSLTDGVDQFIERLTRDHFSGKHQLIFDAIQAIHTRGEQVDFILVWDEIKKIKQRLDSIEKSINSRLDTLEETTGQMNSALSKLLQNLADSGAWNHTDGNIFDGYLNGNRNIATGNINLFGGTQDGSSFIRTNNGETENDLVGGV